MDKKYLSGGAITLSAIVLASLGGASVYAAANSASGLGFGAGKMGQERTQLTETQRAEMDQKFAAVKAAIEANDYEAWVKAEKAMNENSPMLSRITADNFSEYVANYKERQTEMDERQAKRDAAKAAIEDNDYEAWVKAEKAMNENSPALDKINAGNWSKFVEAHKLHTQADSLMQELGLRSGEGRGMGEGMGRHGGRGMGMMHGSSDAE
jgi:hypothetical protein